MILIQQFADVVWFHIVTRILDDSSCFARPTFFPVHKRRAAVRTVGAGNMAKKLVVEKTPWFKKPITTS